MKVIFVCSIAGLCLACSPHAIREAEDVVSQADSLWQAGQMYGVDAGDSATLAQAYETLNTFVLRTSSLGTFSHSCYHYGKLLRAKEDPVAAMQVFIAATHSHTRDYHILGRVYSNMGSICHLAGDYPLSYDMYKKSAQVFLQGGDTLSYYYLLNDMAFELAEQGKKEEAYALLDSIYLNCNDRDIYIKTIETKAVACKLVQQYDSTIFYTSLSFKHGNYAPNILSNRAQAYSQMGLNDSAVHYANELIRHTEELFFINSALYILTHEDDKKDIEDVRNISAERSDTQKLIEIRQGKLSQAAQLLEQDLNRKPDYQWLYVLISIVLFTSSSSIMYYLLKKRKEHSKIIHEIDIRQEQKMQLENNIVAMHSEISLLSDQQRKSHQQLLSNIESTCSTLRNSGDVLSKLAWQDYAQMCAFINKHFNKFADSLQKMNLSEREVRLCVLVLIKCYSDKQMADILCYGEKSIRGIKRYVAKKLGTSSANMRVFLIEMIAQTT